MFMLMLSVLSVVIGVAALAIQLYDRCRNSPTPTGLDRHFTQMGGGSLAEGASISHQLQSCLDKKGQLLRNCLHRLRAARHIHIG